MAYIILFLVLLVWAFLALRDRPLKEYAPIYFAAGLLAYSAEFMLADILGLYEYRSGFPLDPFTDVRLMGFFVVLGIDPLMCVLVSRYSKYRPWLTIVGGALLVVLLEVLFVKTGAMVHNPRWHYVHSFWMSLVGFWLVWRWTIGKFPLPTWFHVDAIAFWAGMKLDTLLSGALWLWHYESPIPFAESEQLESRLIAFFFNGLFQAPLVTYVALGPWRKRWLVAATATLLLIGLKFAGIATGLVVRHGAPWWLPFIRNAYAVFLPVLYAQWVGRTPAGGRPRAASPPPPWEPPV